MAKKRKINCYICREKAEEQDTPDTSRNIEVECPECTKYIVTDMTIRFLFEREDKKDLFEDRHREKLSQFVQKRYDREKDIPVFLDTKTIEAVTGVRSEDIRYR